MDDCIDRVADPCVAFGGNSHVRVLCAPHEHLNMEANMNLGSSRVQPPCHVSPQMPTLYSMFLEAWHAVEIMRSIQAQKHRHIASPRSGE